MRRTLSLTRRLSSVQHLVPFGIAAAALPLLWQKVSHLDPAAVASALGGVAYWEWAAAALATMISFLAVGQYDCVLHRALNTGVPPRRARLAGAKAIALSQTLGLSALTGALVRWRALPELDLWQSTRLSMFVGMSFLGAWAVVTLSVIGLSGGGTSLPPWASGLALAATLATLAFAVLRDRLPQGWLPPLGRRDLGALICWTTLDTAFAALTLWLLLPADILPPPGQFFAAYLLALGAGLMSNTPGGLGVFELTLLAVLPPLPEEPLMAAVLGYRLVYYILPACIALIGLVRVSPAPAPPRLEVVPPDLGLRMAARHQRPDWTMVDQAGAIAGSMGSKGGWLTAPLPFLLVGHGDPVGQVGTGDLAALARSAGDHPIIYKGGARLTCLARRRGWRVLRTARDAVLDPGQFDLNTRSRRQLRRKLRHATKAGVTVERAVGDLPLADLDRIAGDWAQASGGERGFSMGRYAGADLSRQQIFLARYEGRIVAFITFRVAGSGWLLDLIRHQSDLPDGTMHLLVLDAIRSAADQGAQHLSLASVPAFAGRLSRLNAKGAGLSQFKQSFAPRWTARYCAAPGWLQLGFGLASVGMAIHRPRPLNTPAPCPPIDTAREISV